MLAGEEPALTVPGQAVGLVAGLAERGDAVTGRPAAQMIAGHVAPQQALARRVPERPPGEEAVARDLLELDLRAHDGGEARVAELQRHFLSGPPGRPAASQSAAWTTPMTTHT